MEKETRTTKDNTRKRRYECANLHRFTTMETIVFNKKSKFWDETKKDKP